MFDLDVLYRRRAVYSVPGMEEAQVRKDITYKSVADTDLKLDIYHPAGTAQGERLPAVLLVHGDWPTDIIGLSKDLGVYVSMGQLVASAGLAAVNFNHRSTERLTRLYDAAGDVRDLIEYVRGNADELGIDGDRLCIWAFSAGMPVGMWAAMRDSPHYVRCIVAYYGIMDLQQFRDQIPAEIPDKHLRDFSALHYVNNNANGIAPTFIAKAGQDRPGLNESIDRFVEAARAKGLPVEMVLHEEGQHGFDTLDDDERSREIIKRTLAFIREHMG
ncbi:MAG TPA: prolyl oligopeptidase family serine peptidase [Chloroflexia bacterium]|nr:prolyl oligopeptidase family serine peptidase [Chloroflexia bacterium]